MISKKHEVIFAIKLCRFVGFLQLFIHRIVNIGKDLQGHVVQRLFEFHATFKLLFEFHTGIALVGIAVRLSSHSCHAFTEMA